MPEPRAGGQLESARLWMQVLAVGALLTGGGAVAAYATGDEYHAHGHVLRTHTDAVWVLGVLGVALLVAAFVLVLRLSSLESQDQPRRSDWEDR